MLLQNFSSTSPPRDGAGGSAKANSPALPWVWWLALAAVFVFAAAASFMPDERLWGVNHLVYYPDRVRQIVIAAVALLFLPPAAKLLWKPVTYMWGRFARGLEEGVHTIALSGVVSFLLFAAFRASTPLLGDGYYIATNFRVAAEKNIGLIDYFGLVTSGQRIYPATDFVNYAASSAASRFGAVSEVSGVWMLNCLLGSAFVIGLLLVLRKSAKPSLLKMTAGLLVVGTGAVALLFGYIEHYTPVVILGALFVFTAYRALTAGRSVLIPAGLLVAAVLFHVQAVLLVPAFVFLLVRRAAGENISRIRWAGLLIPVLSVVAALAAGSFEAFQRFLLPPVGTGGSYGVFSGAHLVDVLNQVTLICPIWPAFLALAVLSALAGRQKPDATTTAENAFAWCLLVPSLLFLLLFNPELGMARDWDLFAFTVFGLLTPGLLLLQRHWHNIETGRRTAVLMLPALAVCGLVTLSWIGVNASPGRSVQRYLNILEYDRTNAGYAYENLSRYYEGIVNFRGQIGALEEAYEASPNPRYLGKIAQVYYDIENVQEAEKYARQALAARPDFEEAHVLLVSILRKRGALDDLAAACREAIEHFPTAAHFHFVLGETYFRQGNIEEGLKAFETCSKLNPSPQITQDMDRILDAVLKARRGNDGGK